MMKLDMEKFAMDGIEEMLNNMAINVTEKLALEFNFDVNEAKNIIGPISITNKTNKKTKPKKTKPFHLPFCGVVNNDWCLAMKKNYGLYTQCTRSKVGIGNFCSTCQKLADKNNGQIPLITQRLNNPDFKDKFGKPPICYASFMKKHSISTKHAILKASELGWTIPPTQLYLNNLIPKLITIDSNDEKDIFNEIALSFPNHDSHPHLSSFKKVKLAHVDS